MPNAGDSSVTPSTPVTVTFNKPVIGVTPDTFKLTRYDTDTWVAAFVAYDEMTRTALLDPQALLEPTRTYVATLSADIVDMRGTALTGTTSWMFSIAPDTTPPAVTMLSPGAGAVDVPVDTAIVAAFSEQVSNITSMTFFVADSNGPIAAPLGYVSQTAVSLTPTVQLAPQTIYTASLTAAITDLGGNPLLGAPVTWSFTTGADTIPPVIASRFPDINDSDIPIATTVTARFSEAVVGVSATSMTLDRGGSPVPASVTYLPTSRTARLTPMAPLAPNTTYTVTMGSSIMDAWGNAFAAPMTWSFATGS